MDGYSNSTVEQTGTEHECYNGQASYYAWYEMYPKPGCKISLAVRAGDVMVGEVKFIGQGKFVLSLKNLTTGKSYTTTQKSNQAVRQSAEWIVEAPWSGGVLPLANFGIEPFSNAFATISNQTGPISSFAYDKIDMYASDGVTVKALTSSPSTDGTGFSVTWEHN